MELPDIAGFRVWADANYPIGPGWNTRTDLLLRQAWMTGVRAERERASAKLDEFDAWLSSTDDDPAGWAVRQRFNDLAAAIRAQGSKT